MRKTRIAFLSVLLALTAVMGLCAAVADTPMITISSDEGSFAISVGDKSSVYGKISQTQTVSEVIGSSAVRNLSGSVYMISSDTYGNTLVMLDADEAEQRRLYANAGSSLKADILIFAGDYLNTNIIGLIDPVRIYVIGEVPKEIKDNLQIVLRHPHYVPAGTSVVVTGAGAAFTDAE